MATSNNGQGTVPVTTKGKFGKRRTLSIPAVTKSNGGVYVGAPPIRQYPVPPKTQNPISVADIKLYALDLVALGLKVCEVDRNNARNKIWLIEGAHYQGKQKPTWNDFISAIGANWEYKNEGRVVSFPKTVQPVNPALMHRFRQHPSGMPVFITANNVDLGGYIKFYFLPAPLNELLILFSFHEKI